MVSSNRLIKYYQNDKNAFTTEWGKDNAFKWMKIFKLYIKRKFIILIILLRVNDFRLDTKIYQKIYNQFMKNLLF